MCRDRNGLTAQSTLNLLCNKIKIYSKLYKVAITTFITSLDALNSFMEFSLETNHMRVSEIRYYDHSTFVDINEPLVNHSRYFARSITGGSSFIHQPRISPIWVTGFSDAEGSFGISTKITSSDSLKVSLQFKVTQNDISRPSLEILKDYFESGNVVRDKGNALKFQIQDLNTIVNKVLPHFDSNPLVTSKALDYDRWKSVAQILAEKGHIDREGKNQIFTLKSTMNNFRPEFERWNFLRKKDIAIDPKWLSGFIDGEGSFQFSLGDVINRNKLIMRANPTFELAQSTHDVLVLDAIQKFFDSGYIKPKFDMHNWSEVLNNKTVSRYVSNNEKAIMDLIDNHPLHTIKNMDYNDWKTLIEIKNNNIHKDRTGFDEIMKIKKSINRGRISK
jgi:hypothetical protein